VENRSYPGVKNHIFCQKERKKFVVSKFWWKPELTRRKTTSFDFSFALRYLKLSLSVETGEPGGKPHSQEKAKGQKLLSLNLQLK
jgi:hypothetical protein